MSNSALMKDLKKWARDDSRISPDVSNCRFYESCNEPCNAVASSMTSIA
jgi:hypothetical protein